MQDRDRIVRQGLDARQAGDWPAATYLGGLSVPTLEALLCLGELRSFERGKTLVREGERDSGGVFLLLSACTKVTAENGVDGEALLAIRVSGDIIGELSAMDGELRSATVTACRSEPSTALALEREEFAAFLRAHHEAATALTQAVARRLRWANRRRIEFGRCPVKVRAARVIVELAAAYGRRMPYTGVSIGTTLTKAEFASLIGAAAPSVQRALRDLRNAGLIDTGYRTLVARDLRGLRAVAGLPPEEIASF